MTSVTEFVEVTDRAKKEKDRPRWPALILYKEFPYRSFFFSASIMSTVIVSRS